MYTQRFSEALVFAHEAHQNQIRKGSQPPIPYVAHVLTVAGIVIEHGGDEDDAIAALLHDTMEDAGQTHDSLAARFGDAVAGIVKDCTDDVPGVDRNNSAGWRVRKEAYIAHLTEENLTPSVLLISCAYTGTFQNVASASAEPT
jgi:(p)ppGpp synthase/HD superfamily hydrolase